MKKTIVILKIGDEVVSKRTSLLQVLTEDLSNKYSKAHFMPSLGNKFIRENITDTLSAHEREVFDSPLTFQELTEAMQKMKKGKSPGSNGFTACFF